MKLPRTLVADLGGLVGERVRICGFVERSGLGPSSASGAGGPSYASGAGGPSSASGAGGPSSASGAGGPGPPVLGLRDPTGVARLVRSSPPGEADPLAEVLASVGPGSAAEATGRVVSSDDGRAEVALDDLAVPGPAVAELPIDDRSPLGDRLDWRFLDLRRPRNRLIFEVQTTAERAMREHWRKHGFLEMHSPKLRPTPNKSGAELFTLRYFDGLAYLAQSPQFSKQMAMAAGFERVFEIGPVFRANPNATSRHDTEFTSVDVEMSWIESHEDVMAFEEAWLRHVIGVVAECHGEEIRRRFSVDVVVPDLPFPRVTVAEAHRIIADAGHRVTGRKEGDLDPRGEKLVAAHVARESGHEFVFLTEYPEWVRSFYHMRCEPDASKDRSFDLLWKGLEVTTGAQREHRYDRLVAQARLNGVPVGPVDYYLDFFKFGCPPHGGFGLGLTRFLMSLLGFDDVREVTYLHRGPDRLLP